MSNEYRNESRRRPPSDRYGTPGTQYPTANPYDIVITEQFPQRSQSFEPVVYGTPHPQASAALLCFQASVKGSGSDKDVLRIYANPRLAQEPYNLVNGDDEANDTAFPVFVRSYLLPRGYAKATKGQALTALIGLTIVSGGTDYGATLNSPGYGKIALTFTGGTGSGAAGFAEVVNGVIVAAVLTNTGSYTAVPTVGAAGGSGASITALLQPATAYLVDEVETPAEDPFGGYFVRVMRRWETLPGKPITVTRYDPESDANVTTTKTKKLLSLITEGVVTSGTGTGAIVTITESDQIDSIIGIETVTVMPQPEAHDEASAIISEECLPFQFPGTLDVDLWLDTTGHLGTAQPFVKRVPHIKKVWWVISNTRPDLDLNGLITFSQQQGLIGRAGELQGSTPQLADGQTVYNAFDFDIYHFPGSTPDYTEYLANWVGGDPLTPRSVLGSVRRDGGKYRWRVEKIFVQFIMLEAATLLP